MCSEELLKATGTLKIPMTNDYLFRAMIQRNNHVLVSLLCSMMHLGIDTITSAEIINPIIIGASVKEKEMAPTIRIRYHDHTELYLNMQIRRDIHSISAGLPLSVLDFTRIQPMTLEDRLFGIDHWIAFFKATSWKTIKELAKEHSGISEAASTVISLNQDERLRLQCVTREVLWQGHPGDFLYLTLPSDISYRNVRRFALKGFDLISYYSAT